LGVDYVLEGSVRWEKAANTFGRVRVTPQLIRVSDDSHVWAERYDADLADAFQVQASIAQQVATALDVALREPERRALGARPTDNLRAYDYYLRGNGYLNRTSGRDKQDVLTALQMYDSAVALDPRFAVAWAKLARVYMTMYWFYYDRSAARLRRAQEAAETALRIAPGLPEGHIALGYYWYWGHLDYERALEQFNAARARQPNNSDLLRSIGLVQRRQGNWNAALANMRAALDLDPRSNTKALDLGDTYFSVRDYATAERYLDRAITLEPERSLPYVFKCDLYIVWQGDTAKARAVLRQALEKIPLGEMASTLVGPDNVSASLLTTDPSFARLIDALTVDDFGNDSVRYYQLKAESHYNRRNARLARVYGDSGRAVLETRLRREPDDANLRARLGLAYAMMGRKADAIHEGRRAAELLPISRDANSGPFRATSLARIYAMLGEPDAAIDVLVPLLSIPSYISVPELRAEPVWDPLRTHPRFRQLVAGDGKPASPLARSSASSN
jgi:serine/threonine-protein kinase